MLSDFQHIQVPAFSGDIKADVKALLCANHREDTYDHALAVAEMSVKIARQYQLDASLCELGGFLHDISAVIKPADMLEYAQNHHWQVFEAEVKYPFLLHQRMSKTIAHNDLRVTDQSVLSAIQYHSTLKINPSPYDMALFIADKLAWDQGGAPPFFSIVNEGLKLSLEAASLAYMDYIVEHEMIIFPHQWFSEGRDYLRGKLSGDRHS